MKNILMGSIFMLVFFPLVSGATSTPQEAACYNQEGIDTRIFFAGQVSERLAFMQANPQSVTNHNLHWKAKHDIDMALRVNKPANGLPVPPPEDGAFAAFQSKQLSDKGAFFANEATVVQNCLNQANSPTTPTVTPIVTPTVTPTITPTTTPTKTP